MPQPATLDRQQLFDLVWSKPATEVAKDLGVSSVVIGKTCRRLRVPHPPRGYWARLRHGHAPPRPRLPERRTGDRETATLGVRTQQLRRLAPATPLPPLQIAPRPAQRHPAVRLTAAAYRPTKRGSADDELEPRAGRRHHLRLFITAGRFDRSLDLLDQLAWLLERNGFTFDLHSDRPGGIALRHVATGVPLRFSLAEVIARELNGEKQSYAWHYDRWRFRPTGRLRLRLEECHPEGGRKSWGDGVRRTLEELLPDVIRGCLLCVHAKHVRQLAAEENDRQTRLALERHQAAVKQRKEEHVRRARLLRLHEAWRRANVLREFRAVCAASFPGGGGGCGPREQAWLRWVDTSIAAIDPLVSGELRAFVGELIAQPEDSLWHWKSDGEKANGGMPACG